MGAGGPSGGSGTGPQELGYTTRDKRTDKQKQKDANVELGLGKDRISNLSMDNTGRGGEGTNILIAPTVAEVSQSNAANATTPVEEDPLYLRKKKTQAKGRSVTILTSSKGVDEDSTLGKKSLLGA